MARAEAERVAATYAPLCNRAISALADDLEAFAALLLKWNQAKNLVSRETSGALWTRHIGDSLQVLRLLTPTDTRILDLGSGGGFPALPLAIALKAQPIRVTMVEPVGGKASFLRAVVRELGLTADVLATRSDAIDAHEIGPFQVITSRALAPLPRLLGLALPFWSASTRGLFHKGRDHVEEIAEADAMWHYRVLKHVSETDPEGVILEITDLRTL